MIVDAIMGVLSPIIEWMISALPEAQTLPELPVALFDGVALVWSLDRYFPIHEMVFVAGASLLLLNITFTWWTIKVVYNLVRSLLP